MTKQEFYVEPLRRRKIGSVLDASCRKPAGKAWRLYGFWTKGAPKTCDDQGDHPTQCPILLQRLSLVQQGIFSWRVVGESEKSNLFWVTRRQHKTLKLEASRICKTSNTSVRRELRKKSPLACNASWSITSKEMFDAPIDISGYLSILVVRHYIDATSTVHIVILHRLKIRPSSCLNWK